MGLYGKYILIQKIGEECWIENDVLSIIQVYDEVYDVIPNVKDISFPRILPLTTTVIKNQNNMKFFDMHKRAIMFMRKKSDYPNKHLTYLDSFDVPQKTYEFCDFIEMSWEKDGMDEWIGEYFISWQGVDY